MGLADPNITRFLKITEVANGHKVSNIGALGCLLKTSIRACVDIASRALLGELWLLLNLHSLRFSTSSKDNGLASLEWAMKSNARDAVVTRYSALIERHVHVVFD